MRKTMYAAIRTLFAYLEREYTMLYVRVAIHTVAPVYIFLDCIFFIVFAGLHKVVWPLRKVLIHLS
jgi:hypothetical protein